MAAMEPQSNQTTGGASVPYMRLVGNDELEKQRREQRREAESRQAQPHILALSGELRRKWEVAKNAKREAEQDMLRDYRQRNGEYDPDKLAEIRKQGGSEIYMMLTSVKCRAAEAWIRDVMLPPDTDPWSLHPTPEPEMPPDMEQQIGYQVGMEAAQQERQMGSPVTPAQIRERSEEVRQEIRKRLQDEAEDIAERMGDTISDQFHEGGWRQAMDEAISDVVTTKAGFIAGPIIRRKRKLRWVQGEAGYEPQVEEKMVLEYERVSPFDIYPAPDAVDIDDSYVFRRHRLSRHNLESMIGVDGYDDEAIRAVLDEYNSKGYHEYVPVDQQRREIEERDQGYYYQNTDKIEALQYFGPASGKDLEEWGLDVEDPSRQYEVEAWMIGSWIIKAVVNDDPVRARPLSKASYERIPGAFWGRGVSELMRDTQAMCNAAARALANNMGISSGPQVAINDINRIPAGESVTAMYPWKIWQFEGDSAVSTSHRPPIEFFQPNAMVKELMQIYDYYARLSDDYTGIPAYAYGQTDVGGAADTASGLHMLLQQTSKGIRRVIAHIDVGLVETTVYRQYLHNMLYLDDESIKGDLTVEAQGSQSLVVREQEQVRRTEFLKATTNEFDMSIIGRAGRAALLRESAKNLNVDVDEVVPDPDQIRREEQMQKRMMMMQGQPPEGQEGAGPGKQAPSQPAETKTNPDGSPAGGPEHQQG